MTATNKSGTSWRSRIVEQGPRPVAELLENSGNWRRHPNRQAQALDEVISRVGLVQGVILNLRSEAQGWAAGERPALVDGHLRLELARKRGEAELPVTTVDLSPEEERLVLATLDPLSALAETDAEALEALCADLPDVGGELQGLLEELAGGGSMDAKEFNESVADGVEPCKCPLCGHDHARK